MNARAVDAMRPVTMTSRLQRLSSDPSTPRTSARPKLLPMAEETERTALLAAASLMVWR
jgi:hypothetical protein